MSAPPERLPVRRGPLEYLLVAAGLGVAGVAIAGEFIASRYSPGFGMMQTMLTLLGMACVAHGIAIESGGVAARFAQWRAAIGTRDLTAALRFSAVLVQLLLFAVVATVFQLENPAFYQHIIPLTVFGFVVHHFLPGQYRLPFFVALSLAGLVLVLGEANAAWLAAIILAFVGLSRLPVAHWIRVVLICAFGAGLAVLRVGGNTPWSGGIWPVLGSILMFRLIVYLYDLRHSPKPPTVAQTLAYFFLLPNVVFPLFPVVDFATFTRTHYDRDPYEIYQRGLQWLLRGVVHLLLYRLVYQQFTLAPEEVATTGNLIRYLLSTFGLYLRVSGQFHLIVGLLHLFGFRLPETHHLFYLASSFTDFWRRINIYWKDFMMKVVFYPTYFPLRKKVGESAALVIGTAMVFAITWLTHSYQWFWILGSWLLSGTDGLFWGILGVILVFGSLREMKKGRVRAVAMSGWNAGHAVRLAARTVFTFTTICLLWSLWESPTLGEWFDLLSVRAPQPAEWALIAGLVVLIGGIAIVSDLLERRRAAAARATPAVGLRFQTVAGTAAGFALLYLVTLPRTLAPAGVRAQEMVRELKVPELSKRDAAQMKRGYYENLTGVGNQNSQLWELFAQRPAQGQAIWQSGVMRDRDDFLGREMQPLYVVFQTGLTFRTNRWGMRDKDYTQLPAPGTHRVALLGQSYVAGDGVNDGETFEHFVEDSLNQRAGAPPVEVLNFAVGSYSIPQQLALLPKVLSFRPELVILFGNPVDPEWAARHLVLQARRGVLPPHEYLRGLLERARVDASVREAEAMSRLILYRDSILDFTYRQIVRDTRAAGAVPVWVYLATPEGGPTPAEIEATTARARAAGFETMNWSDVYDGYDLQTLQVSPWDFHPNRAGHRVIANRFYRELTQNPILALPN